LPQNGPRFSHVEWIEIFHAYSGIYPNVPVIIFFPQSSQVVPDSTMDILRMIMGKNGLLPSTSQVCPYPLVNKQFAIEHAHRNSGFTH
jgi:hypothetical protein